jgi:protein TonB
MSRVSIYLLFMLFSRPRLDAQPLSVLENAVRIGPGVTPPRLKHKVEPEYSPDARAARVQGIVVLQLAVNETGRPVGISVVSPLGFGLDERAQAAVEKWEFAPGI